MFCRFGSGEGSRPGAARPREDVDVGGADLREGSVFEHERRDRSEVFQPLQHLDVRGVARLRLLDGWKPQLLEEEEGELLGGVDVETGPRGGRHLPLDRGDVAGKLPGELPEDDGVDPDPFLLHPVKDGKERHVDPPEYIEEPRLREPLFEGLPEGKRRRSPIRGASFRGFPFRRGEGGRAEPGARVRAGGGPPPEAPAGRRWTPPPSTAIPTTVSRSPSYASPAAVSSPGPSAWRSASGEPTRFHARLPRASPFFPVSGASPRSRSSRSFRNPRRRQG